MNCPEIVVDVCARKDWQCGDGTATLILPRGRHQVLSLQQFVHEGEDMLRITTVVGPVASLTDIQINAVLRINHSLAYGALAILGEDLVMTETVLVKTDCHEQLAYAMTFIAETADRYEREIYRTDEH
jgi:hypothetical protein